MMTLMMIRHLATQVCPRRVVVLRLMLLMLNSLTIRLYFSMVDLVPARQPFSTSWHVTYILIPFKATHPILESLTSPKAIIPTDHLSVKALFQTLHCSSFRDPRFVSTVIRILLLYTCVYIYI